MCAKQNTVADLCSKTQYTCITDTDDLCIDLQLLQGLHHALCTKQNTITGHCSKINTVHTCHKTGKIHLYTNFSNFFSKGVNTDQCNLNKKKELIYITWCSFLLLFGCKALSEKAIRLHCHEMCWNNSRPQTYLSKLIICILEEIEEDLVHHC